MVVFSLMKKVHPIFRSLLLLIPGNSGGPLLNRKGEVVGVNAAGYMLSQNIGYAIGSRTVLGIYDSLLSPLKDSSIKIPHSVITPKYSFEYNRASPALLELGCNKNNVEGIYVKCVYPNSCFDTLTEGDIVIRVSYDDIYHNNAKAFSVIDRTPMKGTPAIASLDKYGDLTIDLICNTDNKDTTPPSGSNSPLCRKLSIKELFDMIPIGQAISLNICRQESCTGKDATCGLYRIDTNFKYIPSKIRDPIYPRIILINI